MSRMGHHGVTIFALLLYQSLRSSDLYYHIYSGYRLPTVDMPYDQQPLKLLTMCVPVVIVATTRQAYVFIIWAGHRQAAWLLTMSLSTASNYKQTPSTDNCRRVIHKSAVPMAHWLAPEIPSIHGIMHRFKTNSLAQMEKVQSSTFNRQLTQVRSLGYQFQKIQLYLGG